MHRGKIRSLLPVAVMALLVTVLVAPVAASNFGYDDGCSPGFWKNHTGLKNQANEWEEYSTSDIFGEIFGVDYDVTLLEALQGGGGKGIAGAHRILARAATASLLNAAHEGLGFQLRRSDWTDSSGPHEGLIPMVRAAWDSGNRGKMLRLYEWLDDLNNLGCPLPGDGDGDGGGTL